MKEEVLLVPLLAFTKNIQILCRIFWDYGEYLI